MSISALDSSNDLLQQALDAQDKTASTTAASQAAGAFQAQLQQTQGQQPGTSDPNQQGQQQQHHHHGGHHHGGAGGVGASSSKSSTSQPSIMDMMNAIPTDLSAASDDASTST